MQTLWVKQSCDLLTTHSDSLCSIMWTAVCYHFCCFVVPLGDPSALVSGLYSRYQRLKHFLYSSSAQYLSSQLRLPFGGFVI